MSVIVPTYQSKSTLLRCLERLQSQTYPRDLFEILIVDDGSDDETEQLVWTLAAKDSRVRYAKHHTNLGPGIARNTGIAKSRGAIIAFTDSDVLVDAAWITSALPYFSDPTIGGVEGKTIAPQEGKTPFTHQTQVLRGGKYVTANIFYRRDVLCAIGGFDGRFYDRDRKIHFREDSDLAFRVLDRGFQIVFAPDVIAYHPPTGRSFSLPLRLARRYYFDPLLFKKHPRRYLRQVDVNPVGPLKTNKAFQALCLTIIALSVAVWVVPRGFTLLVGVGLVLSGMLLLGYYHWGRTASLLETAASLTLPLCVPYIFLFSVSRGVTRFWLRK